MRNFKEYDEYIVSELTLSKERLLSLRSTLSMTAYDSMSPQTFFIRLSVAPGLTLETKAHAPFRVVDADVISLVELIQPAADKSDRLYNQVNETILAGYNRYRSDIKER